MFDIQKLKLFTNYHFHSKISHSIIEFTNYYFEIIGFIRIKKSVDFLNSDSY